MFQIDRRTLLTASASATLVAGCASSGVGSRAAAASPPDATALADMIRRKQISALEAVDAAIARTEAMQPKLNFLVSDGFDLARERARSPDLSGPFAGVPFLVKDLNDVKGLPTKDGMRARMNIPPETRQGPYIDTFTTAGLVVIGKASTPEMGFSATTEPLAYGPTRNPWNPEHSSGGSSGGSAVAVAAGVVPVAHANDGGGSIRMPASCCGVFGLKPTRGRLVKDYPGSSSIDFAMQHVVSMSVRDSAALLAISESGNLPAGLTPVGLVGPARLAPLRVAVVYRSDVGLAPHPEVRAGVDGAVQTLTGMGHSVEETRFPMPDSFMDDFMVFWASGAYRTVARAREHLGREPDERELEPFTFGLAAHAAKAGPAGMEAAIGRLKVIGDQFNAWLATYDVVVSPVLRTPPPKLGYLASDVPFETLMQRKKDYLGYTPIHNISGAPAMSVPLHWTADGLPVGVQFSARPGGETLLIQLAYALEAARPWAGRRPPIFAQA